MLAAMSRALSRVSRFPVTVGLALKADCRQISTCMRRLAKQFELSGQCRDAGKPFAAKITADVVGALPNEPQASCLLLTPKRT
jgi:hypothetical protein